MNLYTSEARPSLTKPVAGALAGFGGLVAITIGIRIFDLDAGWVEAGYFFLYATLLAVLAGDFLRHPFFRRHTTKLTDEQIMEFIKLGETCRLPAPDVQLILNSYHRQQKVNIERAKQKANVERPIVTPVKPLMEAYSEPVARTVI